MEPNQATKNEEQKQVPGPWSTFAFPNFYYPPAIPVWNQPQIYHNFNPSLPPPPPPPPYIPPKPLPSYDNTYYACGGQLNVGFTGMNPNFKSLQLPLKMESVATNNSNEISQRENDQTFVNEFVARRNQSCELNRPLKIHEGLELTNRCLQHVSQLKALRTALAEATNFDASCRDKINEITIIKDKIEDIFLNFNPANLSGLKYSISKRIAKRKRLHDQKKILKNQDDRVGQRQKLHEKIDAWQSSVKQKLRDAEMETKLKQEADMILSEVRKKKLEANKLLSLIESVEKLRILKKESAQKRSHYSSIMPDEDFHGNISNLRRILDLRLADYEEEEKTLQVMLTEEHQETRKTAQQQLEEAEREKLISKKKEEHRWLFGPSESVSEDDPRYPYWMAYTQANRDLDTLVEMRRKWDFWIVPSNTPYSSGIPINWVLPSEPSSKGWAKYLIE